MAISNETVDTSARQQILLWHGEAGKACMHRQFIRAIHLYEKCLERARLEDMPDLRSLVCRDLAYVYLHHGSPGQAVELTEEGLALKPADEVVYIGLMAVEAMALLKRKHYREGFEVVTRALEFFDREYPDLGPAPPSLLQTYASLRHLQRNLRKVVDYLQSGMNPERVQVDFTLARPPWK